MNLDRYQEAAAELCHYRGDQERQFMISVIGLTGEAGETADRIKKWVAGHLNAKHPYRDEGLANELGDVLWYLSYLALLAGYNLSEIAEMNLEKLHARYGGF